ncbi:tetratricopeptide repeat protein 19, mitochondrial-like [Saccostrea echinata]|uniref:tetratricopeptide repeat protein 19, mitochondrial-like n=1 Tax=Saccostrea echinata TaxID=191078 RepID=UPI002A811FE9|nr:tetratricopeptide repeat protein 19, mitochondrial-like [Saccostrea echinata]
MSFRALKVTFGCLLKLPRTLQSLQLKSAKLPRFNYSVLDSTFIRQRVKNVSERVVPSRKGTCKFLGTVAITRAFLGLFGSREEKDPVKEQIRLGHIAVAREDYQEADNAYHLALHAAQQQFQERKIDKRQLTLIRIYVFDALGNIALKNGDLEKAEKLYKETLKVAINNEFFKQTDNGVVEISMRLAAIYAMMGKDEETHSGYQFCIKTQEDKIKENPEESPSTYGLLGMCLESYAKYLLKSKQYEKALEYLQRSEEIVVTYLGNEHPQRIVALNDIASLYIMKNDLAKAEEILKKALAIGHASKDSTLPVLYCNLGALYLRQSKIDKALENCKMGEKLGEEMHNPEAIRKAKFCIGKCTQK